MFKNRAMQVQMVKTPKNTTQTGTTESHVEIDFNKISTILKEQTKNIALVAVAAVVILKMTDTACEIAINYAPKN